MHVRYRGNVEIIDPRERSIVEARIVTGEPAFVHRPDADRPIVELRRMARALGVEDLAGSKAGLIGRITAARG
jgi:hypothetical protein